MDIEILSGRLKVRVIVTLVIALSACSGEDSAGPGETGGGRDDYYHSDHYSDADIPSIYIDRRIEDLDAEGKNPIREGYGMRLSKCREAGIPTKPLEPEEEALVGTRRWQLWRMPGRLARRAESWAAVSGEGSPEAMCSFELSRGGYHEYFDTEKTVSIDLDRGKRELLPADTYKLDATPFEGLTEEDRQMWSGWPEPVERHVQGQPCMEWRSPRGSAACYWSGGGQWGFEYANQGLFHANAGISPHSIVLSAEPSPGTRGIHLTTEQFVIGGTIDPTDMLPDSAADIQ